MALSSWRCRRPEHQEADIHADHIDLGPQAHRGAAGGDPPESRFVSLPEKQYQRHGGGDGVLALRVSFRILTSAQGRRA